MRWRLRERVLGPFGEDSAEVELRAALGDAGDPPAGESCRSIVAIFDFIFFLSVSHHFVMTLQKERFSFWQK